MFCSKCGTQMVDDAKFCPKCGAQSHAASIQQDPQRERVAPRLTARTWDIIAAVGTAALALISFMPLVRINVLLIGGSYSLLDLVNAYNQLEAYIVSSGVSSGASAAGSMGFMNGAVVWFVVLMAVWVAALISSVVTVGYVLRGKKAGGYGFVLLAVFSVLCTATVFVVSSMLADAAGSYTSSVSSMITPTSWLWVLTIGSLAGLIAFYASAKR